MTDHGHTPLTQEELTEIRRIADNWTTYGGMDDLDSLIGTLLDEIDHRGDVIAACQEDKHSIIRAICDDVDHPHHVPAEEAS